jgi:hypothetical protein
LAPASADVGTASFHKCKPVQVAIMPNDIDGAVGLKCPVALLAYLTLEFRVQFRLNTSKPEVNPHPMTLKSQLALSAL